VLTAYFITNYDTATDRKLDMAASSTDDDGKHALLGFHKLLYAYSYRYENSTE